MQLGDFYEFNGLDSISIQEVRLGAGSLKPNQDTINIQMHPVTWETWNIPTYHERLKQSYFILREAFDLYH